MQSGYQEMTIGDKRKFWQRHVHSWQQSGLSQSEYCRRNAVDYRRWRYWKKRSSRPETNIAFVPFDLPALTELSPSPVIRVITPNGFKIELEGTVSLQQLIRDVVAI